LRPKGPGLARCRSEVLGGRSSQPLLHQLGSAVISSSRGRAPAEIKFGAC